MSRADGGAFTLLLYQVGHKCEEGAPMLFRYTFLTPKKEKRLFEIFLHRHR